MSAWYYVKGSDRVGPVEEKELQGLFDQGVLTLEGHVWKKGFDNWKKIKDVAELSYFNQAKAPALPKMDNMFPPKILGFDWKNFDHDKRIFTIKVGLDRGMADGEQTYGPFSLEELKLAYNDERINGKTLLFAPGMESWEFLADTPIYDQHFSGEVTVIEEVERRVAKRRPFVARLLFHDSAEVYEGVCQDVSIGGLQLLVANYPASVGDSITMNVHPDNSEAKFVASGKIVRVLPGNQGFSIRFTDLGADSRAVIERYVESN
jgi:hypothetical protein